MALNRLSCQCRGISFSTMVLMRNQIEKNCGCRIHLQKVRAALECKATVLNINEGHNEALMKKCQRLEGYSYFVEAVRRYLEWGYELESLIDHAIAECVEKDKIADILIKNRAEVKDMLLTDFDEKKYRKMLIRDSKAEVREKATEILNELNRRLFEDGRIEDLKRSCNDRDYQEQLLKEYGLNKKPTD